MECLLSTTPLPSHVSVCPGGTGRRPLASTRPPLATSYSANSMRCSFASLLSASGTSAGAAECLTGGLLITSTRTEIEHDSPYE